MQTDVKEKNIDDILNEKLSAAFHHETSTVVLHSVAKIASEHLPIDLAYAARRLPPQDRPVLYDNLSNLKAKIEFIINTDSSTRAHVFLHLTDDEVKRLIEQMPPDEAVKVLEDIPERRFRRVVDLLDAKKALRIKEIQKHPRNTAGRLMTNEFFAFGKETTIREAARAIRDNLGVELTRGIFVLDQQHVLQGYVPARNLIVNFEQLPLGQVMRPVIHKVSVDTPRQEVVDIVERYKIFALPVVDANDRLLGIVTQDDVLEAIEDIADETIASMAGVAEKVGQYEGFPKRFFARTPWLVATLLAGLINVGVMSTFQSYEGGMLTFVLFFVPLITGMSGNIGIQCSTVLVRSMATGVLSPGNRLQAAVKELVMGLLIGAVFGVLCGSLVYLLDFLGIGNGAPSPILVGSIVGFGLFGACTTASLLGVFSPLFFNKLKVDPALASGPIITACNDILSMTIYFLIAMGLRALLL